MRILRETRTGLVCETPGALEGAEVKRLRKVAAENKALKRLLAERDLQIDAMKQAAARKG